MDSIFDPVLDQVLREEVEGRADLETRQASIHFGEVTRVRARGTVVLEASTTSDMVTARIEGFDDSKVVYLVYPRKMSEEERNKLRERLSSLCDTSFLDEM